VEWEIAAKSEWMYTVSQKNVPPLQLAVIFTYTVRLRQFLAQMLPRYQAIKMYFIFPPYLTSASCTTWGNRKPTNCVFSLKCYMLFHQKTRNTVKNITWSQLNHPSLSRRSTGCTRQDLGTRKEA